MPIHLYKCPQHGTFFISQPTSRRPPKLRPCPTCHQLVGWRPPTGISFTVEGGTGAAKGARDR